MIRLHRSFVCLAVILVALIMAFGCSCTGSKQGKAALSGLPKLNYGDKVSFVFKVEMPSHLYFNGPRPVVVRVPGNTPFKFTQNEYVNTTPTDPTKVYFEVAREAPTGRQKIQFGLQFMYCNKANDICLIKNDVFPVEVLVEGTGNGPTPGRVTIEKTYKMEDKPLNEAK